MSTSIPNDEEALYVQKQVKDYVSKNRVEEEQKSMMLEIETSLSEESDFAA